MAPKKRKKKDKSPTQNNQYHKCTVYSRNKALIYYNTLQISIYPKKANRDSACTPTYTDDPTDWSPIIA